MSEKRIIRRRRAGSTGSDSDEEVVLSGASQEDGVSYNTVFLNLKFILLVTRIILISEKDILYSNNWIQVTGESKLINCDIIYFQRI